VPLKTPDAVVPSATTVGELDVILFDRAFEVGLAVAPLVCARDLFTVLLERDQGPAGSHGELHGELPLTRRYWPALQRRRERQR
jgi:hypothetical protein